MNENQTAGAPTPDRIEISSSIASLYGYKALIVFFNLNLIIGNINII